MTMTFFDLIRLQNWSGVQEFQWPAQHLHGPPLWCLELQNTLPNAITVLQTHFLTAE